MDVNETKRKRYDILKVKTPSIMSVHCLTKGAVFSLLEFIIWPVSLGDTENPLAASLNRKSY
jgi:hypothetical protein